MTTLALLARRFNTSIADLEQRPMWQIADLIDIASQEQQG